jgi:hypothetical protein
MADAAEAFRSDPLELLPTDVIIAPYAKGGTTWLQQMFHTLRTGGDMDFDDVSRVVPWLELSPLVGISLNAPQRAAPRGFKSHLSYDSLPKGARYVVSFRDPKDSFVSMYHFACGFLIDPATVSMEEYFETWVEGGGPEGEGYWRHLKSWWAVRHLPNVMFVSYNQLLKDRTAFIRQLAAFAGIPLSDALLALTVERTSRAYMLHHQDKFHEVITRKFSETAGSILLGRNSPKVRPGSSGDHKAELPAALAERLDAIWEEEMAGPLGFADFQALETALIPRASSN